MYTEKYLNSFKEGIKNSFFRIYKKEVTQEVFFVELCELVKILNQNNGRLFFFGNGASEAFSNHMALDWSKNGKIISYSLSDSALITALSNDFSFEESFVEYLKIYNVNPNDFVVTTSSSGNSKNIKNVINFCNDNLINTISLSGLNSNNYSFNNSKHSLFVPMKTYGMVECIHQYFHHLWLDYYMNIEEWNKNESQNMNSQNFKL